MRRPSALKSETWGIERKMSKRSSRSASEHVDPEFKAAIDALVEYRQVTKTQIGKAAGLALSGLKRAYAGKGSITSTSVADICRPYSVRRSEFWKWGEDRYQLNLRHELEHEKKKLEDADPEAVDIAIEKLMEIDPKLGESILLRHLKKRQMG